jgi:DNA-binding transcriptional regulator PaaX
MPDRAYEDLDHYQSPALNDTLTAVHNGTHTLINLIAATGHDEAVTRLALLRLHTNGYLNMRPTGGAWQYYPTAKARRARTAAHALTTKGQAA